MLQPSDIACLVVQDRFPPLRDMLYRFAIQLIELCLRV